MKDRRYDIDWLRVIAMLAVFIFHCVRFFDTELFNFPLKNAERSFMVDVLRGSLIWPWVMELFFLLSGFLYSYEKYFTSTYQIPKTTDKLTSNPKKATKKPEDYYVSSPAQIKLKHYQ